MTDELPTGEILTLTLEGPQAKLEEIVSVLSDTWDVVIVNGCESPSSDQQSYMTVVLIDNPTKGETL
jgi:hypothetical protein